MGQNLWNGLRLWKTSREIRVIVASESARLICAEHDGDGEFDIFVAWENKENSKFIFNFPPILSKPTKWLAGG